MNNFDQDVFDYTLEDLCVKVANVKSVKKCLPGRLSQTPTRTPCVHRFIVPVRGRLTRSLVAVEPRRPPMTDAGTETAFRLDQRKHFRKSKHLLRSEVN